MMRFIDIITDGTETVVHEGGLISPLNPKQARKRAEKERRRQEKIHDENARHAAKLRQLRARTNDQ